MILGSKLRQVLETQRARARHPGTPPQWPPGNPAVPVPCQVEAGRRESTSKTMSARSARGADRTQTCSRRANDSRPPWRLSRAPLAAHRGQPSSGGAHTRLYESPMDSARRLCHCGTGGPATSARSSDHRPACARLWITAAFCIRRGCPLLLSVSVALIWASITACRVGYVRRDGLKTGHQVDAVRYWQAPENRDCLSETRAAPGNRAAAVPD
jgi:hypothetical protein